MAKSFENTVEWANKRKNAEKKSSTEENSWFSLPVIIGLVIFFIFILFYFTSDSDGSNGSNLSTDNIKDLKVLCDTPKSNFLNILNDPNQSIDPCSV